MKKIYKGAICTLLGMSLAACSDFLDVDPHNKISDEAVWGNLDYAETFLNNCYLYVEGENQNGVPFCSYTDEIYHRTGYATEVYTLGNVSCDNYNVGYSDARGNTWYFYYNGIKKTNQLLERIDDVPATSNDDIEKKEQITGQAYFLRAFFYHQLYSLYGRIPLVYHTFDMNAEWTETRADMDEVADSIVADCNRAAQLLPTEYSSNDFGRATKGAALAVKARTLLYKASPLFGTSSTERWKEASDAQMEVIELANQGIYSLPSVSNYEEYAALFCNAENPEIIFEKLYDSSISSTAYSASYPMSSPQGAYNGYNGWGVWLPTYNITNVYQKADGTDFSMSGLKNYNIQIPSIDDTTGEIVYKDSTIVATEINPYDNREMRFYANILYDGSLWGYGDDNHAVQIYESGQEGVISGEQSPTYTSGEYWNATQTGYYLRKFMNANYNQWDETIMDNTPWIFFRLAEFYLNYAECQIELGNNAEALKYINLIRKRVNLPDASGINIREEYEYERKVELMFEGQRFFDLRRWKRMEEAYSTANLPTAMKVYKLLDGTLLYTHSTTILQKRSFREAMYWMPVPRYELNKCPNLDGRPYED